MSCCAVSVFTLVSLFVVQQQFGVIECRAAVGVLNFLALGDWGGLPITPYTTAVERAVAKRLGIYADHLKPEFIMGVGDNFYFTGVRDVDDHRFKDTFEDNFDAASLDIPWYFCAGNHDHYGNVSAEIAYTERSKRWNFPYYHYTKTWTIPGTSTTIQLVMIDTIILCGNVEKGSVSESQPKGPEFPDLALKHWEWLEQTLAESTADYLLVAGHFPVWSISEHGPTDCLVTALKPMLEKNKVTAYICGHDHNLQHLDDNSGVQYIVTGCANFVNPSTKNADSVPKGSSKFFWADKANLGGFTAFTATPDDMTVAYVESTSLKPLYIMNLKPRDKSNV